MSHIRVNGFRTSVGGVQNGAEQVQVLWNGDEGECGRRPSTEATRGDLITAGVRRQTEILKPRS